MRDYKLSELKNICEKQWDKNNAMGKCENCKIYNFCQNELIHCPLAFEKYEDNQGEQKC